MYGTRAKELLLEVKRGDGGIPAYNVSAGGRWAGGGGELRP